MDNNAKKKVVSKRARYEEKNRDIRNAKKREAYKKKKAAEQMVAKKEVINTTLSPKSLQFGKQSLAKNTECNFITEKVIGI